jgi:carbamate kinase
MKRNLALAMNYYAEWHFIKDSMRPKIESVIKFIKETQGLTIITNPEYATKTLQDEAEARITS